MVGVYASATQVINIAKLINLFHSKV